MLIFWLTKIFYTIRQLKLFFCSFFKLHLSRINRIILRCIKIFTFKRVISAFEPMRFFSAFRYTRLISRSSSLPEKNNEQKSVANDFAINDIVKFSVSIVIKRYQFSCKQDTRQMYSNQILILIFNSHKLFGLIINVIHFLSHENP